MENTEPVQLSLFDRLRRLRIGEVVPVPATDENVGGELLNILSKGLYTNPLDALREYVQNSIDADAQEVYIQVTGNSVTIFDWGHGMTLEELLQAREFGVSNKSMEENVGFRGIGIYSGFDLCERLVVRTKPANDKVEYVLEFEFGVMRKVLEAARKDPSRPITPLLKLLSENTYFVRETASDPAKSYTQVELQEITDEHIYRLADVKVVTEYLLRNLPIRFDPAFEHATEIEQALIDNVEGYKSATVFLKIDDADEVIVQKPRIPNLDKPIMRTVTVGDKKVAFWWACLVSGSVSLASDQFERGIYKDYAGFLYKVKGFTIGDRNRFRRYLTRIYDWWTGEIYVIDTDVIPTSARDDFEAGRARDTLDNAVRRLLSGSDNENNLQKYAVLKQQQRRADAVMVSIEERVTKIADTVNLGDFDQFKLYAQLEELNKQVKSHRSKATSKDTFDQLSRQISELQIVLRQEIENPTPVSERKKDATKSAMEKAESKSAQEDNETTVREESDTAVHEGNGAAQDVDVDVSETSTEDEEPAPENVIADQYKDQNDVAENVSLLQLIANVGWKIDDDMLVLLTIVSESINDVLGASSEQFNLLILEIEERLAELIEEEE